VAHFADFIVSHVRFQLDAHIYVCICLHMYDFFKESEQHKTYWLFIKISA